MCSTQLTPQSSESYALTSRSLLRVDGRAGKMAFIVMARFINPLFVRVRVMCLKCLATVFHFLQKSNSCKVLQVTSADKFLVLKLFQSTNLG